MINSRNVVRAFSAWEIIFCLAVLILIGIVFIPTITKKQSTENSSMAILAKVEAAKQQFIAAERIPTGRNVSMADLKPYLPRNFTVPTNLSVTPGKVGEAVDVDIIQSP